MGRIQTGSPPFMETAEMNANDLLIWLSAKGSGSWSRFRAAVDELYLSDDSNGDDEDLNESAQVGGGLQVHHRLRLNLERLGHTEFFRKGFQNGWRVVPPTLACLSNKSEAVGTLCGARTDQLLARIENVAAALRITVTGQPECPDRIQIIAQDQSRLQQFAESTGLYFQPDAVRMLLAAAPSVDDPQLRTLTEMPFGTDWEVNRFSVSKLRWTSASPGEATSAFFGLFRFYVRFQHHYYLCLRGKAYRVPVQVGKYIVLRKRRLCVISYDEDKQTLSMPVSCRPPLLIDRALTLCTGLIPGVENGRLEFHNINKTIALTTSALMRQ